MSGRRLPHCSTYDPELAACMDRWIRVVFLGQRRMQSSLAKAAPNHTTSACGVVDITNSNVPGSDPMNEALIHEQEQSTSRLEDSSLPGDPTLQLPILSAEDISKFRKEMECLPIDDHGLPPRFRPLTGKQWDLKPMFTVDQRKDVEVIWNEYLSLTTRAKGASDVKLALQDYTRLMRTLRYGYDATLAATRIVEVERDSRNQGIISSWEMCEMAAQAHIILGAIPDSIRFYEEAVKMVKLGSPNHEHLLWSMVDGFAINQMTFDGIAFLDRLPDWDSGDGSGTSLVLSLYKKLYLHQYKSIGQHKTLLRPLPAPESQAQILLLTARPLPPVRKHVLRTFRILEKHPERTDLIHVFSKTVSGMLIKSRVMEVLQPLIQSLLISSDFEEATRVLDMMKRHGVEQELDKIRRHLLQSFGTCTNKYSLKSTIEQWDAYTLPHPGSSSLAETASRTQEYSDILRKYIQENDLTAALGTAKYMSERNWIPQEIDHKLSSFMVNHGRSSDYPTYIEVRYTLGGSLVPDLHTYRRLIYAACRRSDLFSALTLFKLIRTRHPDWKLDVTLYNAIISTAATTGHIQVAEKTFSCMLEDGVQPDHFSFHGLMNGYGEKGDLEAAVMIPEQMIKQKLNPTTRTFNLAIKAYLGSRMDLTTSRKLLQLMQTSGVAVPPDLVTFNQMLEGYRRVGNTMWFNAYFDEYFGPPEVAEAEDTLPEDAPKRVHSKKSKVVVRPESSDDRTLLIQLKHSLLLPNVDLPTVQELWRAIKPKLMSSDPDTDLPTEISQSSSSSEPSPNSSQSLPAESPQLPSSAKSDDNINAQSSSSSSSSTYVPFNRYLSPVWMPATDRDHFRFSTLTLFRSAFESRGDVTSVKKLDKVLAELFPQHPLGEAVLKKKTIKWIRGFMKSGISKEAYDTQKKKMMEGNVKGKRKGANVKDKRKDANAKDKRKDANAKDKRKDANVKDQKKDKKDNGKTVKSKTQ
ncbi:hypothetical protein BGZ58_000068 [Dissophora ornata]|nr:hypothetical protein BGZ58_000068 [Dissophora ornata]